MTRGADTWCVQGYECFVWLMTSCKPVHLPISTFYNIYELQMDLPPFHIARENYKYVIVA